MAGIRDYSTGEAPLIFDKLQSLVTLTIGAYGVRSRVCLSMLSMINNFSRVFASSFPLTKSQSEVEVMPNLRM
jgi:hypothetical protein